MTITERIRAKYWWWRMFGRFWLADLWRERHEIFAEKRARLRGARVYGSRSLEFADGRQGYARQKHMIVVAIGFSGWKDTGIVSEWTRLAHGGAENVVFRFRDIEFEDEAEAIKAFEAASVMERGHV